MLVECGYVRAQTPEGGEYSFAPSFARIAALGHPHEIVSLNAGLYGPQAAEVSSYILAVLCEQADPLPLLGWTELDPADSKKRIRYPGAMPEAEQLLIARHLMQHGIAGKSRPGKNDGGSYSVTFDAAEYVAVARVHLGMNQADAEALSMTEFHRLLEVKFPDATQDEPPDSAQYEQAMEMIREKNGG